MTRCVAFTTPGLIPLEAFTTFGVNAKPNSTNPFGYFGTGLKYAISVCLRNRCQVVLWRGKTRYDFYTKAQDFRGKDFDFVRMKKSHWNQTGFAKYSQLPFTLELGKNWELWQAFRELETNTRDEGGITALMAGDDLVPENERTTILVFGSKFVDEFHEMDRHFLPEGKTVREGEAIQVIDRPSKHVYYRGVRIMDLKEEAEFTYNILQTIDLTEDRTAKYSYQVEQAISRHWIESEDEERVQRVTSTSRWESSGLSYGYAYATPSRVFMKHGRTSTNPSARQYTVDRDPSVSATTTIQLVIPRPDITENELQDICNAVAGLLGLEQFSATNMTTQERIDYEEVS
jgi:hypothetical protein